MSALKIVAIVLLNLFLSLSLVVFGFAFTINMTALNADYVTSQLDDLPVSSLMQEVEISTEESLGDFPIEDYLDDVAAELEPWIKEQAGIIVPHIYDYVLGKSQSLDVVISLEPVRQSLEHTLREAFLESPPPELVGLSSAELEQEFDTRFEKFAENIPATFALGESRLEHELSPQVAKSLEDAEEALGEAQRYIGYFNLGYGLLIGFIVLLVLGIILIYREVKGATRTLGATFLTYGVINIIAVFVARGLARPPIARLDIPLSLQTWLTQLINSSLTPLLILAIVLLIVGAALLTVFFIYRRRQTPTETEKPL